MNESGLTPLGDIVLVRVADDDSEKVTAGGIVIPDSVADKEAKANIVARIVQIGELAFEELHPDSVRSGEFVVIERYAGRFVKGKDKKVYRLIKDTDVLAVCEEKFDARYAA